MTDNDVCHFPETRLLSTTKNTVAATIAIEIIQNVTPTTSFGFRSPANASDGISVAVNIAKTFDYNVFIKSSFFLVYYLSSKRFYINNNNIHCAFNQDSYFHE